MGHGHAPAPHPTCSGPAGLKCILLTGLPRTTEPPQAFAQDPWGIPTQVSAVLPDGAMGGMP